MVDLSKCACLYILTCTAWTIVWNQELICLWLCLQLFWGGPLHLHHPLHYWDFSHSWDFSRHFFYTVTFLIGYHCINWYQSTPVHSCAGWIYGADVTIGIFIYLHSKLFLQTNLLLVSCGDLKVTCALYTSLILVFHGDGTYLPLCILNNSATCIPQRWHIFSCALCTSPTVLYAQCKLLRTLIRSLGVWYSIVSWYHLLVVPESSFLTLVADWCYGWIERPCPRCVETVAWSYPHRF